VLPSGEAKGEKRKSPQSGAFAGHQQCNKKKNGTEVSCSLQGENHDSEFKKEKKRRGELRREGKHPGERKITKLCENHMKTKRTATGGTLHKTRK